MRQIIRKGLCPSLWAALLSIGCVIPLRATIEVDGIDIAPTCNSYTLTAWGAKVPALTGVVKYSFNAMSASGPAITITDSFPITPDEWSSFAEFATKPLGPLAGSFTFALGSVEFDGDDGTVIPLVPFSSSFTYTAPLSCGPPPPPPPACSATSANSSDFNGTPIKSGYIWFNADFTAKGIPSAGATVTIQNATIQFTEDKQYNLAVPNARITFSPAALCATTTFDTLTNTWNTTVPIGGSDEIFATGLSFPVPAGFVNAGGKVSGPVVWNGTFGSSAPGIAIQWKWGAAVYASFSTDYNALKVLPTHSAACGSSNGDHAGTPEGTNASSGSPFRNFVIGGARGGGGSNFTGSWSGTFSVNPVCH